MELPLQLCGWGPRRCIENTFKRKSDYAWIWHYNWNKMFIRTEGWMCLQFVGLLKKWTRLHIHLTLCMYKPSNSGNPDQTAPLGAVWSGSTLFVLAYQILSWNLVVFHTPLICSSTAVLLYHIKGHFCTYMCEWRLHNILWGHISLVGR